MIEKILKFKTVKVDKGSRKRFGARDMIDQILVLNSWFSLH